MKSLLNLGLALALLITGTTAFSETSKKASKKTVKKTAVHKKSLSKGVSAKGRTNKQVKAGQVAKSEVSAGAKLSTDISFNDSTLHGRYQTPDEASVRVENEKVLRDLLAVRTDFKDRLKKSSEQN